MSRRLRAVAAGLAMTASTCVGAETYREGLFGFDIADYASARDAWSTCAEAGDYRCQFGLGILYNAGHGVPVDHIQALNWFERAAKQGSTDAALELGILYAIGPGDVAQDPIAAYAWILVAARDGDPVAEDRRALMRNLLDDDEATEAQERAKALLDAMRH